MQVLPAHSCFLIYSYLMFPAYTHASPPAHSCFLIFYSSICTLHTHLFLFICTLHTHGCRCYVQLGAFIDHCACPTYSAYMKPLAICQHDCRCHVHSSITVLALRTLHMTGRVTCSNLCIDVHCTHGRRCHVQLGEWRAPRQKCTGSAKSCCSCLAFLILWRLLR